MLGFLRTRNSFAQQRAVIYLAFFLREDKLVLDSLKFVDNAPLPNARRSPKRS